MNSLLLDTNIVSYALKEDSRIDLYANHLADSGLVISQITYAELLKWGYVHNWGKRRLEQLEQTLQKNYTIIPVDLDTCRYWAIISAKCRKAGTPISSHDAWIAASAMQYRLTVVTHNHKDFQIVEGLKVITEA